MNHICDYSDSHIIRNFDIEAISLPIVYNKYGDHDPNGLMYVLSEDAERIMQKAQERFLMSPPQPYEEVQPLVIRANVGDEICINFHNRLNRRASIHVQGLACDVLTSDGANVGYNPDTTTLSYIKYRWFAEKEGVYLFSDMADTQSSERGTNVHGLFGAIIIEKAESSWLDPVNGQPLKSGLFADICHPFLPHFREYAVFFHDELEILNKDALAPSDPHTGLPSGTTAISYRAEPMRNRMPPEHTPEHIITGEDISMSSWVYGDPAPFIPRAYVGDPTKIRLIHGGIKETHVFHLHNHQWRLEPDDPKSAIIDSISLSPQECYTLDILHGAGSLNGMIGDAIFHCHLYPHFHEGMWTLWRIFDRLQDGSGRYPDGTRIEALMPLNDRPLPPQKDELHPGYPNYINGRYGQRPMQPPLGVLTEEGKNKIEPSPAEKANFAEHFAPGALYTETCPCGTAEHIRVFDIAAVQADIKYNSYGWHDPQGRFFVLKQEIERYGTLACYLKQVECGQIVPEPLVIRANAGDCIEIRFTNLLPEFIGESAFQLRTLTDIAGYHIHLVKFDTIVSDGSANGWNNIAGARQYETLIERFYADEELHTVFFHDHLFANSHQQHGLFGALIVEPTGASWFDPSTGSEINHGTRAVIRRANGESYREFALFVHDFALLFDKEGRPLNAPEHPGSDDDPGVMGINYRCEPMPERLKQKEDPAHIFSSLCYGDPATPILETYPGEPMVIRLLDGAHEEQHAFNLTGLSWKKEIYDPLSPIVQEQTIGISEAFNIRIDSDYSSGDYLYYFGGIDDLWLGLWGILRVYHSPQKHLPMLCTGKPPAVRMPLLPPKDAVVRRFEIAAVQADIEYNRYGDHDPEGLIFLPYSKAKKHKCKKSRHRPLILRANAGDWLEVKLYNMFDPGKPINYNDYPSVPLDMPHVPSNRVSLNAQFMRCDPVYSSGINVGFNDVEQTAAPGECITYIWHADKEYEGCILSSFGDLRNHRHHGLFGALITEAAGAEFYSTEPGAEDGFGDQAVIVPPGEEAFREFVLLAHNGIRLLDKNGKLIKTTIGQAANGHGAPDHEDTGEKGYNYRSERFFNRLERNSDISRVFDSKTHGDPATPVFKAYAGERIVFRLLMPADKPRNISFLLHGHVWRAQPKDPLSNITAAQGAVSIGGAYTIEPQGMRPGPGDYMYRSGSLKWDVESGMWGILRILRHSIKECCLTVCKKAVCWCKSRFNR